ncbi:MAG: patatin-like phospholipase family protein [Syntrophales bacterium LBB04]|nr:patatin-like phospholipase family protein [Syntrophales bacterium LBB04]
MKRQSLRILPFILVLICSACAPQEMVRPSQPQDTGRSTAPQQAKIALVLGAGASRGFAHIGALKVPEANKVPINMIIGTSAGSFVGSLSAYGLNAYQLQKMALALEKSDLVDLTIPDNGFIKGDKLEEYLNSTVKNTPIEKFKIPFYAVATSIPNGQEVIFGQGNAGMAVRASCSIPGIFRPKRIADKLYVDGGVVSPVAVDAAKKYGADIVIAVDIAADHDIRQPEGTIDTILQAVNIMYSKLASIQLGRADVVIRPKVGHIGSSDFDKRNEAIMEGEKAAIEALPALQNIIARLKKEGRLQ